MNNTDGILITLEGIEGAGKSTHLAFVSSLLAQADREVISTREPGGTLLGEQIRELLLRQDVYQMDRMTELLLMFAARVQHLQEVVVPALRKGKTVLCDRFIDSSYAYQGGGRGIPAQTITRLVELSDVDLKPDLTLLFDVPAATGLERIRRQRTADRFENEQLEFFQKVRAAYLDLAAAEPDRVYVIDTDTDIASVQSRITQILRERGLC